MERAWSAVRLAEDVDMACEIFGGRVLAASNQHYGPAARMLAPEAPLGMHDGFESKRSREPGHFEAATIALGPPGFSGCDPRDLRILLDFTYFVNNNPREVEILGGMLPGGQACLDAVDWQVIVSRTFVKPYRGNQVVFRVSESALGSLPQKVSVLLLKVFPDGGLNRIRVFLPATRALLDEVAALGLRGHAVDPVATAS